MRNKKNAAIFAGLLALVAGIWLLQSSEREVSSPADAAPRRVSRDSSSPVDAASSPRQDEDGNNPSVTRQDAASTVDDESSTGKDSPKTPEELKAEAEESAVESFDGLTDRWMEPSGKGVTLSDVDAFVSQFRKVPTDRKEECLQRALNLVPDENVMLLAGILMDKSQPKELVELVFDDILNRDESVKKPILRQIMGDKSHPCWADTAWILDVIGEKTTTP